MRGFAMLFIVLGLVAGAVMDNPAVALCLLLFAYVIIPPERG